MNDWHDFLMDFWREMNEIGMPAYALLCSAGMCLVAAWLIAHRGRGSGK